MATYGEGHRNYLPVDHQESIREELYHAVWMDAAGPAVLMSFNDMPRGTLVDLGLDGEYIENKYRHRSVNATLSMSANTLTLTTLRPSLIASSRWTITKLPSFLDNSRLLWSITGL